MKNLEVGKIVRWGLAIAAIGLVVAIFVWNATSPENDQPIETWEEEMTYGDPEAENHFIEYIDMMCPYCTKFYFALHENFDDFKNEYLNNNKIYYEVRLADIVSEHSKNSYRGNIAGYCAARQEDKFWPFYDTMQRYLNENYYSKNIGSKKGDPEIPKWENDIYYAQAKKSGLNMTEFKTCFDNQETKEELDTNTQKAQTTMYSNSISGVPFFIFNDYTSSGFEGNYNTIKQMFKAGGAL